MNCLGRANYSYFLGMLLSLSLMLTYGAYLAHHLLDRFLMDNIGRHDASVSSGTHWSIDKTFTQRFDLWMWAFTEDIRIGAVGMLAIFTAPLGWGLFGYHIYLIWAGMTTNESFKWSEWKDDITDGYVFKCMEPKRSGENNQDEHTDPYVPWPVSSPQRLVSRANKLSLEMESSAILTKPPWEPVRDLSEIINIYDLGFWDNLTDVFHSS